MVNAFITAAIIWAGFSTSGSHYNPVVTVSNIVFRPEFKIGKGLLYIFFQIVASLLAALIVILMTPLEYQQNFNVPSVGQPYMLPIINQFQCFVIEFFLSFLYVYIYYGSIYDKRAPFNVYGIAIGGVILAGTISFGPYTGACINPIRIIGPSIVSGFYENQLIFWFAHIAGGLFGSFYYHCFIIDHTLEILKADEGKPSNKNSENYNLALNLKY
jgi:glycerol uptake facilitator-like aquaporin